MNDAGMTQKVLDWITLALAGAFIVFGIGVVSGIFFSDRVFMGGTFRYVLGIVLIAYGIIRIGMITRRMKREKREKPLAEKT